MTRTLRFLALTGAVALWLAPIWLSAQETPPPPAAAPPASGEPASVATELRELRQLIDRQNMQLEMLTREVAQLRRQLDGSPDKPVSSPAAPGDAPAPPPEGAAPTAAEIPRAEATGGGVKHIVAKGETLTSISKHYNVALPVLQKANRIQDGRKLQIGQVLSIPTSPEPSPDKKENP